MRKGKILINADGIIGKRLGKLKIVGYAGRLYEMTKGGEKSRHFYICKCDCGNTHIARRDDLIRGHTHSCGCIRGRKNRKTKGVKVFGNSNEKQ